ncbi:MAG TPA: glycosyltransferase family 39 protein, partial [Gemmatimonadaceae bacterium]|nr:glycosyltransferase family 39 protein [Gemmatimonadaceae bacterium]
HFAAGMQGLTTGAYTYDLQHPPLGRIAAALGPFIHGERTRGAPGVFDEGAGLLGTGQHYVDTLASARHGEIAFFVVLAIVVWAWGRRLAGEFGAVLAVLFVVTNPNLLAHGGLATTDIACAATTTLALYVTVRWIDRPSWANTIVLGVAIGLAVGSRLSSVAFLGGAFVACYLVRAWARRAWSLGSELDASQWTVRIAGSVIVFALVVWALYRFDVGRVSPSGMLVPAPAFVSGIDRFLLHGGSGHPSFLLGRPGNHGWWYYFPVALAVKTPIPLLLLSVVGGFEAVRSLREQRDWSAAVALVAALAMLAMAMVVRVDLGVRLILPIYALLGIVASQGALALLRQRPAIAARTAVAALAAWSVVSVARSYPDHLAYFNALAGDQPERILVDSNLDWGQDLYRLRDTIVARGIRDSVRVAYFGTADLAAAGVPNARQLGLHERASGWVAASETYLAGEWVGGAYAWLLDEPPTARIGRSMRLWYIPPARAASITTDSSRR